MFCDHCGAQLAEAANYCPKCGKSQRPAANVQMKPLCPKCGKDLVLSQPDGSPLLDSYVHMECPSCRDNVRYTVIRSSVPDTTLNIANVQKQHVPTTDSSLLTIGQTLECLSTDAYGYLIPFTFFFYEEILGKQ